MTTEELGKQRAEELGLRYDYHAKLATNALGLGSSGPLIWYLASDIHKLLGECVEFEVSKLGESNLSDMHRAGWSGNEPKMWPTFKGTHKALLIGIRLIEKPDTAEAIVQALVDACNKGVYLGAVYSRAKKLLEGKE